MQLNTYETSVGPYTEALLRGFECIKNAKLKEDFDWSAINGEAALGFLILFIALPIIFAYCAYVAICSLFEFVYFTTIEWLNKPIPFEAKSDKIILIPSGDIPKELELPVELLDLVARYLDRDHLFSLSKVNSVFRKYIFSLTFKIKLDRFDPVFEVLGFNLHLSESYFQTYGSQLKKLNLQSYHHTALSKFLPYCLDVRDMKVVLDDYDSTRWFDTERAKFQWFVFPLICNLANLNSLSIKVTHTANTDSMESISSLTNLRHLSLEKFSLDDSFTEALMQLTQMRSLRLTDCRRGYNNNKFSEIFENEMTQMTNLEVISINKISFSEKFYQNLEMFTNLIELNSEPKDIYSFSHIVNLTNLTKLQILKNHKLEHDELDDIGEITKLTNLVHLTIESVPIKHNIKKIANLHFLQYLDVSSSYFDPNNSSNMVSFVQLDHLTSLNVADCGFDDLTPIIIEFSEHLNNLTDLNISKNKITNEGLWSLAKFTNLKKLSMSGLVIPPNYNISLSPFFSTLTNLESLDISSNIYMVEDLIIANELTNLTCLNIKYIKLGNSIEEIAKLTNLTSLSVNVSIRESLNLVDNLKNLQNIYFKVDPINDFSQDLPVYRNDLIKLLLSCKKLNEVGILPHFYHLREDFNYYTEDEEDKELRTLVTKLKNKFPNVQIIKL